MFLRETWLDTRIGNPTRNENEALNPKQVELLWVPCLIVKNQITGKVHEIPGLNQMVHLQFPIGEVMLSSR